MNNSVRKIYKHTLKKFNEIFELETPPIWNILHLGEQNEELFLWVDHFWIGDPEEDKPVKNKFMLIGTGVEIPKDFSGQYFGSVIMKNGLVWHLYVLGYKDKQ